MPSEIQVTVRFQDQCVFAGEDVKCTITFRNAANISEPPTPGPPQRRKSRTLSIEKLSATSPRFSDALQSPRVGKANYPPSAMKKAMAIGANESDLATSQRPGHRHQRSVSIISIGSRTTSSPQDEAGFGQVGHTVGTHRRSSTIQVHTGHERQRSQNRDPSGLQIPVAGGRRSPLSSTSASTPTYESRRSTPDFHFPPPSRPEAGSKPASREPSREPSSRIASSAVPPRLRREPSVSSRVTSERSSGEFYSLSNHSGETLMSEQPSVMSERPHIQMPSAMMRRHYRLNSLPPTPRRPQAQPVDLMMGYAHLSATFTVDGSLVDQSSFEEVKQRGFLGGQAGGGVVGVAQKKPRPTSGFLGGFNFNSIGESLNTLVGGDNMSSVREMNAVSNSRAIPLLSTPQSLLFVNLHLEPGGERSYSFTCPLPRGLPSSYRGKAIKINYNLLIGVQSAPTSTNSPTHRVKKVSIPIRVFSGVDAEGEILGHDLMQPHILLRDPARTSSVSVGSPSFPSSPSEAQTSKYASPDALQTYVTTLLSRPRRRHSSTGSIYDPTPSLTAAELSHPTLALINRAILTSTHRQLVSSNTTPLNRFNITRAQQPIAIITLSRPLLKLGETLHLSIQLAPLHTTAIRTCSVHCSLETTEKVAQSLAVRSASSIARVSRKVYATWSAGGSVGCLNGKRLVWGVSVPVRDGVAPGFVTTGFGLDWGVRVEFGVLNEVGRDDEDDGGKAADQVQQQGDSPDDGLGDESDESDDEDEDEDEDEHGSDGREQLRQAAGRAQGIKHEKTNQKTTKKKNDYENDGDNNNYNALTAADAQIFEDVVTDERGVVSIAVEKLDCESFEVTIPITVYGDALPLLGEKDEVRTISI